MASQGGAGLTIMAKNILLIAGGDSSEHEISLISAKYVASQLEQNPDYHVLNCVLHDSQFQFADGAVGYFTLGPNFVVRAADGSEQSYKIDCAVPCLHGFPGETGDIQAMLMMHQVPFIGCDKEASINCFNKVTTKLYFTALNIENTPYIFIADASEAALKQAHSAFANFGNDVYVKAASQGSSIGCYHVTDESKLDTAIKEALSYSPLVLVEKTIVHRELEVAAYEYNGELHVTDPGEIIIPQDKFYTFDEKYSADSSSTTTVEVKDLSPVQKDIIKSMARRAFVGLHLRHLSRIDFFLGNDGVVYLNEINTFPGMTPISMFPKLVEHAGLPMSKFFSACVEDAIAHQAH